MFDLHKPSRLGIVSALVLVVGSMVIYANLGAIVSCEWLLTGIGGIVASSAFWWLLATSEIRDKRQKLAIAESTAEFSVNALFFTYWLGVDFGDMNPNSLNLEELKKALNAYKQNAKRLESVVASYDLTTPLVAELGDNPNDKEILESFNQWVKLHKGAK